MERKDIRDAVAVLRRAFETQQRKAKAVIRMAERYGITGRWQREPGECHVDWMSHEGEEVLLVTIWGVGTRITGERNTVHLITAGGTEDWPPLGKGDVAMRLAGRIALHLAEADQKQAAE